MSDPAFAEPTLAASAARVAAAAEALGLDVRIREMPGSTRTAEEAKGLIRWLRPEFQAPGAVAPQVNATLDLGDAPAAAPATIIPWP